MAAGGPEAPTASALAEACGMSKANLFHHFESLDDVVLAAFEDFILGMQSLRGPSKGSLREWLTGLMAEATASVASAPQLAGAYLAFVARARSDARLRARIEQVVADVTAAFAAIIASYRPLLDETELQALASLVLVAGDGMVIHRDLFPGRAASQAAAWQTLVDLIAGKEDGA
jgi:AcrR family transcriptional regulator